MPLTRARAIRPVALVAGPTRALVRSHRVAAHRVHRARVPVRRALVHVGTVERVHALEAGQTLARVVAHLVDAARVQVTVVAIDVALRGALVDVCGCDRVVWVGFLRIRIGSQGA